MEFEKVNTTSWRNRARNAYRCAAFPREDHQVGSVTSTRGRRTKTLRRFEALLPDYEISPEVWKRSIQLADRGRASGVTVPLADLVIFTCARIHGLDVAHDDTHFDDLAKFEADGRSPPAATADKKNVFRFDVAASLKR